MVHIMTNPRSQDRDHNWWQTAPIDAVISAAKQARAQQLPGWDDLGCIASMRISEAQPSDQAALTQRLRGTPGGVTARLERVRERIDEAREAIGGGT